MLRSWSILFGIGLVILGIVGASSASAPQWMAWIDIVAGVVGMIIGATVPSGDTASAQGGWPLFVGGVLFVMWLVQLVTYRAGWLAWWNFVFACAYVLGAVGYFNDESGEPPAERDERPRKAA